MSVTGRWPTFCVAVLLCWSTVIGDWSRGCTGNDVLGGVSYETTLTKSDGAPAAVTDARTDSPKPQLDTSAVWRTNTVYATSSWKTITTTPAFTQRMPTTAGNNSDSAATITSPTNRGISVSSAPMTRFSGSSADVISSTQPAAETRSSSHKTTRRPLEPSISATPTTMRQFFTDADVGATTDELTETVWRAVTTDAAAGEADGWLSLSVAWVAGVVGAGVVIIIVIIVAIIVISRRLKSSRSSVISSTVRYHKNKDIIVDMQPRRGKRSKAAASVGVDMDGVCITYTRSQPPSSARGPDSSENVFIGAFPRSDRWLTADNDRGVNDLFEKDSDTSSTYEQGTSTFCARNLSYRGHAPVSVENG